MPVSSAGTDSGVTRREQQARPAASRPSLEPAVTVRSAATPATVRTASTPAKAGNGKTAAAADGCPEPEVIVRKLQARYDTTAAFRADFRQETTVAALGQSEEAHGTVAFKKPGKMRWEFRTPHTQSIVSDGTTLWIYQPAERQVLKVPFHAAFVSTTPVSFLAGVGRISDDFRAERDRRGCSAGRVQVYLVPRDTQDLGSLAMTVDPETFDIVEASVTDPIGNVTTVSFTNVERNAEIADREFRFELPPGVDVVAAPAPPPGTPAPGTPPP